MATWENLARDAQSYTLGMGQAAGAATQTLTGTAQQSILLQDLTVNVNLAAGGNSTALVTAIRVAGQRIDVTNAGMDANAFSFQSQMEGQRSIGIAIEQQQQIALDITPANAADICGAMVGIDSMLGADVIPVNMLGNALNYCGGLGSSGAIAAGTAGLLTATILRPCVVGRVGLTLIGTLADFPLLQLRSVTINNLEYMAGASGAGTPQDSAQAIGYQWSATDRDGLTLGVPVETNDVITLSFFNGGANPITVQGGFFCLPELP